MAFDQQHRQRAIALFINEQWSCSKIAEAIGCNQVTVNRWLKDAGLIKAKKKKRPQKTVKRINTTDVFLESFGEKSIPISEPNKLKKDYKLYNYLIIGTYAAVTMIAGLIYYLCKK